MAGWTKAPEVHFSPFSAPAKSLAHSAESDGKCSLGPLLISSLGTRIIVSVIGGSSNLNTVTALLMVLALTDSRAQPGTQQQECGAQQEPLNFSPCSVPAMPCFQPGMVCLGCPVLAHQGRIPPHAFPTRRRPCWSHLHEVKVAGHGHEPGHGELGMHLGINLDLGMDLDTGNWVWGTLHGHEPGSGPGPGISPGVVHDLSTCPRASGAAPFLF